MRKLFQNKKFIIAFLFASSFFMLFLILGILRNRYYKKPVDNHAGPAMTTTFGKARATILPKNWKYHAGDSSIWKDTLYNDSLWLSTNPELNLKNAPKNLFTGIGWLRVKFSADSNSINKILLFIYTQAGASEVYLDAKLLGKFGKVSTTAAEEVAQIPNTPLYFTIKDFKEHLLSVRFSNQGYAHYIKEYRKFDAGISDIEVLSDPVAYIVSKLTIEKFWIPLILLFAFFTTLGLVHFLLFIFYRKQIQNLYYSIFVLIFALIILSFYYLFHSESLEFKLKLEIVYFKLFLALFMISIMACLHSLFKPSLYKRMFLIEIALAVLYVLSENSNLFYGFSEGIVFSFILFTSIECVRTVAFGIIKKMPGSKIIGAGVGVFFLFVVTLLFEAFISGGLSFVDEGSSNAVYFITLVILCIISIPLSMSIYLARNFAFTNKNLEQKLIEVEELSAKSIEQEKEKQHILENQNITLEKQVIERTFEITEQKKVIEEKNKDIIDSINYAKRIQSAMLPDEASFKAIFDNSFVLYMPRDIVSGDFYYATEINGDKLIIAADCTGHGVPGALMSMVGCNIINKLTHENKIIEPKIVLQSLHTQLRQALKQDTKGSVNRDGMDVAAVLINDKEVIFASANRPLIYFDAKNQLQELKATKTPIGGSHIEAVNIEQHVLPTENIKQLYLFSDGFADQFGGPEGKKLMVSKFKLWLTQIINLSVDEQHKFLADNFTTWKKESEQVDDVMVIGIKLS